MKKLYFLSAIAAMAVSANAQQIPAVARTMDLRVSNEAITVERSQASKPEMKAELVQASRMELQLPQAAGPRKIAAAEGQTWVASDITVTLTDDAVGPLFGLDCITLEDIAIEESQETPGFYRLVDPYANYPYGRYNTSENHYMYVHTEFGDNVVYFDEFETGLTLNSNYGEMLIRCEGGDYVNYYDGTYTPQELANFGISFGKLSQGNITFETKKVYVGFVGNDGAYYANTNGKFAITFPGAADYSLNLICPELYNDTNAIPFTVEAGADIAQVIYLSLPGKYPASDGNLNVVADYGQAIQAGVSYSDDYSTVKPGFVSLFAVGLDANGNRVAGDVEYFVVINHEYYSWTSLGYGVYTDDLLSTYGEDPVEYEVEVEECDEIPGYYRIKNPFGPDTPYYRYNAHEGDADSYLYINASDPEHVVVEFSVLGLVLDEDGEIFVLSAGAYNPGTTSATAYGVLEDGVITFANAKNIYMGFGYDLEGLYNSNTNGAFSLELPEAEETMIVFWDNTNTQFIAPHVHYSIDGGATYDVPVPMIQLGGISFADDVTPDPTNDIWGAMIPAGATHVRFSDGGSETLISKVFEAEDGMLYQDNDYSGIANIGVSNVEAVYYNMQGMRVEQPAAGNVYIVRRGNSISKEAK